MILNKSKKLFQLRLSGVDAMVQLSRVEYVTENAVIQSSTVWRTCHTKPRAQYFNFKKRKQQTYRSFE